MSQSNPLVQHMSVEVDQLEHGIELWRGHGYGSGIVG